MNNPRNEGPNRRQCPLRIRRLLAGILPDAAEGKGCFRSQRLNPRWTEPTTGAVHYLTWTEQVFTKFTQSYYLHTRGLYRLLGLVWFCLIAARSHT